MIGFFVSVGNGFRFLSETKDFVWVELTMNK